MSFQHMMTDEIKIIKASGEEFSGLKASVQSKGIYLMQSDILVEPNDLIQRVMSNGGTETFEVIDPGFHEKFHSIPAHYQMKVQKLGVPEAKKAIHSITYNISGPNARVNNNSVDKSVNTANVNESVHEQLALLRKEIESHVHSEEEKKDALEVADAIEEQFDSGSPRQVVVKSLVSALPHVASIASIGSFFISAVGS